MLYFLGIVLWAVLERFVAAVGASSDRTGLMEFSFGRASETCDVPVFSVATSNNATQHLFQAESSILEWGGGGGERREERGTNWTEIPSKKKKKKEKNNLYAATKIKTNKTNKNQKKRCVSPVSVHARQTLIRTGVEAFCSSGWDLRGSDSSGCADERVQLGR